MSEEESAEKIMARRYDCFFEGYEPKKWSDESGRCAGYAGQGALRLHLPRCKRRNGYGVGGLFCKQHSKDQSK